MVGRSGAPERVRSGGRPLASVGPRCCRARRLRSSAVAAPRMDEGHRNQARPTNR